MSTPRSVGHQRQANQQLHLTDALAEAASWSDWHRFRNLYRQYHDLAAQDADSALLWQVRASMAEALADMECAYGADPATLAVHVWAQLADINGDERLDAAGFESLYRDNRLELGQGDDRRRPSLLETAVETPRRWRDAAALTTAMAGTGTSGILCGSVNYSPFYGVRGNTGEYWPSDLDFVVVTAADTDLADVGKRLGTMPGICGDDVDEFAHRIPVFAGGLDDGRTVFSHKFGMWTNDEDPMLFGSRIRADCTLSIHFVPPQVLAYALVESSTDLITDMNGGKRPIRDYRNRASDLPDQLHSFDGRRFRLLPDSRPVELGTLRRTSAYYIDEAGRYYLGFYQTITQPRVNLRWDEAGVSPRFDKLRHKLAERLRFERHNNPGADLRPTFAHLRYSTFAPHVVRLLDAMYSPN